MAKNSRTFGGHRTLAGGTGGEGGGGGVLTVSELLNGGVDVDNTDPQNPIIGLEASVLAQLVSLPGPWITVPVPADTAEQVISTTLTGDLDGGYEVDFVGADTSDLATVYTLRVARNAGALSATGCFSVNQFGNGAINGTTASGTLFLIDVSSVVTGQNPIARCLLQSQQNNLPRAFFSMGNRGATATTNNAVYMASGEYIAGAGNAAGQITGLSIFSTTAAGIKAGSLLRYRKLFNP